MTITFVACVLPLFAYTLFLYTSLTPLIGTPFWPKPLSLLTDLRQCAGCLLLGVTHGLLPAAVFPSIALIVPHHVMGTAYGILTSALNTALFISPFLLGLIPEWVSGPSDIGAVLLQYELH